MKKITLTIAAFIAAISMNAQTVLFEDDFESYDDFIIENVGDWTMVDNDGLPTYGFSGVEFENSGYTGSFIVFNSTATTAPLEPSATSDWSAYSGEKAMTSFAAVVGIGESNDDWLISPQITLGNEGNMLSFWAKATTTDYPNETFSVGISTTDTDPTSFTMIATDEVPTPITYEEFTFDLDAYANQDVYIAIHHTAADQFGFQIDDFSVTADGTASVADFSALGFEYSMNVSTNELSLTATTPIENVKLFNILGQEVLNKKTSTTSEVLNLGNLNSGVYIAQVEVNGLTHSFKIVKK